MTSTKPLVQMNNIFKSYRLGEHEVHALNGVSLNFETGDFVSLCGASGSGKSTLLNLIAGFDSPTKGEIYFNGEAIEKLNDNQLSEFRNKKLGFVFQNFNLFPVLNASENVEYPLLKTKLSSAEKQSRVLSALKKVGLEGFHEHKPSQLSGGQRQRVAIARAIVHSPELIIADEPTASLDSHTGDEVIRLLDELNKSLKVTIVIATHDPKVMRFTRKVINIKDGKLVSV